MSRVLLISANMATDPYPVYPLGMAVIAAALSARGHRVRQLDMLAEGGRCEEITAVVRSFDPEYIGISLRNIDDEDSLGLDRGWYLPRARVVMEAVRAATAAPVLVGGPALSILPEEILDYLGADYAVVGEGEKCLPDLLDRLFAGMAAPRITRASEPRVSGAEMFRPLLDARITAYYVNNGDMLNLQTKRGCPYRCSYCIYPWLEGRRFRHRPAEAVVDDIEWIQGETGVRRIFFTDSVFNDPEGRHLQIAEEILRRDLKVHWYAFFRPQNIARKQIALMKRAGLCAMELGTDAATDATLAGLNKGIEFSEILEVNRHCLAEDVPCAHYVLFGGPEETPETLAKGLDNIEGLGPAVVFAFSGVRILKGTALHRRAVAEGIVGRDTSLIRPVYYHSGRVQAGDLNSKIEERFRGRRDRIFPPSEGRKRLEVVRRFGYRGVVWDKLWRRKGRPADETRGSVC